MMNDRSKKIFFAALAYLLSVVSPFFLSCHKVQQPFITAFLIKSVGEEGDTTYYKEIYLYSRDGFSMIPQAQINETTLPITDFDYHYYLYSEDRRFTLGQEYKMTIKHSDGEASSRVFVPSDFLTLKPQLNFVLKKDSSLLIVWQKAVKATWYFFSLYLSYSYIDTLGLQRSFRLTLDTAVNDTTLTYSGDFLFPKDCAQVNWGEGTINIWAIDGSSILPGAKENIRGAGRGFYNGANHSGERYFRIGQSGARTLFSVKEMRERLMKRLRR